MKRVPYFDVQDKKVPLFVKDLMLSYLFSKELGNDQVHNIDLSELRNLAQDSMAFKDAFVKRNNSILPDQAVKDYKNWLISQDVNPTESVIVAIWW